MGEEMKRLLLEFDDLCDALCCEEGRLPQNRYDALYFFMTSGEEYTWDLFMKQLKELDREDWEKRKQGR